MPARRWTPLFEVLIGQQWALTRKLTPRTPTCSRTTPYGLDLGFDWFPWQGAVQGSDNWMKVIRDGDGCVSWAQFEFDFTAYPARPLVSIPLYVSRPDCADFSLADVVAAAENPNPDTDGDGVPDDQDAFPNSNLDPTVVIGGCDSSVGNQLLADGSTFNDLIGQAATNANNHGEFVSAVAALANQWKQDGLISGRDKGKITSCAS